jgi:hypothetical protein
MIARRGNLKNGKIANKSGAQSEFFWHMNCGKKTMARKMSELKSPPEIGGQAEVTNRRPALPVTPYLAPFHSPTKVYPPKRRLEIAIEVKTGPEVPYPVKIIHSV